MKFDWWTFALQAINFLVLVWLLRRFLFQPVTAIMAQRKAEISKAMDDARASRAEAEKARAELESARAGIEAERLRIVAAERARIETEHQKMLEQARGEIAQMRIAAERRLDEERAGALDHVFDHALKLSESIAARLLRELGADAAQTLFLDRITRHLDGLSASQRAALIAGTGRDTAAIVVATAAPLDNAAQENWRRALTARLGNSVAIEFTAAAELIAGAEVRLPHATVRFNWRDSLAEASREMRRNG